MEGVRAIFLTSPRSVPKVLVEQPAVRDAPPADTPMYTIFEQTWRDILEPS